MAIPELSDLYIRECLSFGDNMRFNQPLYLKLGSALISVADEIVELAAP